MTPGGLLLRVMLMLSLLLNGLNVAVAAPMALAMITPATADAAPPCHGDAPAPPVHAAHPAGNGAQAPHDGDHCKIKECLRSCAQQPSLTVAVAWLPSPPPPALAPITHARAALPTPPLDRITRPPIG
ncbi:CopL family metal-binding regulatory protein [Bacillus subtilis subsp. subtilis]|nr:CopL family metal-binding regulatory protein [Bacillus subtilis subsp. subtilis]